MTATTSNEATKKAKFQEYEALLRKEGFCFLASEKQRELVLFNPYLNKTIPTPAISLMFSKWDSFKTDATGITDYLKVSLPLVVGTTFKPCNEPYVTSHGCTLINSYRQYKTNTESDEVSPILLEYFSRLFPDNEERHICLQWLAHIFQKPLDRPSWHLLLSSEVGTGKGFLFHKILTPLLIHTSQTKSYDGIMGKHATVLESSLLVMLDDPKTTSEHTMTKLKSVLTEPRILVEHKHAEAVMVDTYSRIILASNEERPLRLSEDERRWYVPTRLTHKEDKKETQQFIEKLSCWLSEPDSLGKVYNWFMKYNLTGFNPNHIHQTASLKKMIGMGKNALDGFFIDYFETNKVFTYPELKEAIQAEGYDRPKDTYLKHVLEEEGFVKGRFRNKSISLWHPASMDREAADAAYPKASF